jgi:hypothetical protein
MLRRTRGGRLGDLGILRGTLLLGVGWNVRLGARRGLTGSECAFSFTDYECAIGAEAEEADSYFRIGHFCGQRKRRVGVVFSITFSRCGKCV